MSDNNISTQFYHIKIDKNIYKSIKALQDLDNNLIEPEHVGNIIRDLYLHYTYHKNTCPACDYSYDFKDAESII